MHHRDELDRIQRELRDTQGTTILIYDQTCATEKRRRRKRGTYPDPARRAFINDAVCEGCGDCSVQSNCLSVEPMDTPLGTKRKINQSSCNKDFSCVKGFCPSFVTAEGAQVRKPQSGCAARSPISMSLPLPALPALSKPYGVLVTGVGGTGVVTIGGLIGMAAHIERKGVTVLDMAGLAQKGGAVLSHVQIAPAPRALHATRIATGEARLVIGCDAIVSASNDVLSRTRHGITQAAINSGATPTAAVRHRSRNGRFPRRQTEQALSESIGAGCEFIDANALALKLLGDTIYSNPLLLGFAWQKGWLPLELREPQARDRTEWRRGREELARVRLGPLRRASRRGRSASSPTQQAIVVQMPESLENVIATRRSVADAPIRTKRMRARYRSVVERMREKEKAAEREAAAHARRSP